MIFVRLGDHQTPIDLITVNPQTGDALIRCHLGCIRGGEVMKSHIKNLGATGGNAERERAIMAAAARFKNTMNTITPPAMPAGSGQLIIQ